MLFILWKTIFSLIRRWLLSLLDHSDWKVCSGKGRKSWESKIWLLLKLGKSVWARDSSGLCSRPVGVRMLHLVQLNVYEGAVAPGGGGERVQARVRGRGAVGWKKNINQRWKIYLLQSYKTEFGSHKCKSQAPAKWLKLRGANYPPDGTGFFFGSSGSTNSKLGTRFKLPNLWLNLNGIWKAYEIRAQKGGENLLRIRKLLLCTY